MSSIAGELITERLDYDGGRHVTVYIPPAPAEAVVFRRGRSADLEMERIPRGG